MNIRRLNTPKKKINRVINKEPPSRKKKTIQLPTDKYTWEDYYAERNFYYGVNNETRTDK